jgi:hypothetical protein
MDGQKVRSATGEQDSEACGPSFRGEFQVSPSGAKAHYFGWFNVRAKSPYPSIQALPAIQARTQQLQERVTCTAPGDHL